MMYIFHNKGIERVNLSGVLSKKSILETIENLSFYRPCIYYPHAVVLPHLTKNISIQAAILNFIHN